MNKFHKIVKYFAIFFATFIIGSIISSILLGITILNNISKTNDNSNDNLKELTTLNSYYSVLDIELESSNVLIKESTNFKIESNNKNIIVNKNNSKLIIKEKKSNWFSNNDMNDLIIYIPTDFTFDNVSLETGAGNVDIKNLSTKTLELNLGAGKVNIDDLTVFKGTEIDGGAGEIIIENSDITNLDLDMGLGKLKLNAKIQGNSKIDSGIGTVDITLLGDISIYKIKANKGLGNFLISGVSVSDGTYHGNGFNFLDVNGGIGKINIDFK